ncbi:hypothetical protein SANTM175S_01133 [Streptomyces antimycoticus]
MVCVKVVPPSVSGVFGWCGVSASWTAEPSVRSAAPLVGRYVAAFTGTSTVTGSEWAKCSSTETVSPSSSRCVSFSNIRWLPPLFEHEFAVGGDGGWSDLLFIVLVDRSLCTVTSPASLVTEVSWSSVVTVVW